MRSLYLLALTLLLSGVAGCDGDQQNPAKINNAYVRYAGTPNHFAYEFHLADGTRCVGYGEGITCEWQTPVVLVPRPQ